MGWGGYGGTGSASCCGRPQAQIGRAENRGSRCPGSNRGEEDDRRRVAYQVTNLLAEVTAPERIEAVDRLQQLLGTHVPTALRRPIPPSPGTRSGIWLAEASPFGPHTLTHPNLAELAEAEALREIEGSWTESERKRMHAAPSSAFPTRLEPDEEVLALPKAIGLEGAVTAEERYSSARDYQWTPSPCHASAGPTLLRRFAISLRGCPGQKMFCWVRGRAEPKP